MYITILRFHEYLVIAVLFLSLLPLFYLSQPALGQGYRGQVSPMYSDPSTNTYMNDNTQVYIQFPADWAATENADSVFVSMNGAQLEDYSL